MFLSTVPAPAPAVPSRQKRPSRLRRWLLRILVTILVLVIGLAGAGTWWLRKSLPQVSGLLHVAGLQQPVNVTRDQWGVPHIQAQNLHDLYLAQGFVTAQDRLFQMDLSRRAASGRLSELIGSATIKRDTFFRTLGLRRAAEASLPALSVDAAQKLQWYADGVNAFIDQASSQGRLSPEFSFLKYTPEHWTPVDSLVIGKYMAYDLGGYWTDKVFRYLAVRKVGDKALDLWPTYPKDGALIIHTAQTSDADPTDLASLGLGADARNGSNNWVVAGSKTQSGKPLLANDPHLGLGAPAIWYQTQLQAPGLNVIGVTFPGAPGIVVGHNDKIAWGVTNLGPDVQDLYIEKPNPANPKEFLYNGKYEPATVAQETIKVKGQPDVPLEVLITRHGPIITGIAGTDGNRPTDQMALRWTALAPTTELEAVLGFDSAQNWDEFKQALTKFEVPAQNFVFASVDGTIAYRGNGLIPVRKKGDGTFPVPGWTDDYEWTGYIPWDQLPTVVNPTDGYIATANNKVVDDSYPYFISSTWAQPYREARIQEVLKAGSGLTVRDMERLQFDFLDGRARSLMPALMPLLQKAGTLTPQEQTAEHLLAAWAYQDDPAMAAPLIWNLWARRLEMDLFQPRLGDLWQQFENRGLIADRIILDAAAGKPGRWVSDPKQSFPPLVVQSFQEAVAWAAQLQGKTPEDWRWGKYHQVPFDHPLGAVKPLNLLFNIGATPIGGGAITVGAMGFDQQTGLVDHGAPWRQVVDLANIAGNSWDVTTPGESGHPLSQHYSDQVTLWTHDQYHPQAMDPALWGSKAQVLTLNP